MPGTAGFCRGGLYSETESKVELSCTVELYSGLSASTVIKLSAVGTIRLVAVMVPMVTSCCPEGVSGAGSSDSV